MGDKIGSKKEKFKIKDAAGNVVGEVEKEKGEKHNHVVLSEGRNTVKYYAVATDDGIEYRPEMMYDEKGKATIEYFPEPIIDADGNISIAYMPRRVEDT